jgi:hypothetical protein
MVQNRGYGFLVAFIGLTILADCSRRPVSTAPAVPLSQDEVGQLLAELERDEERVVRYQAVLRVRGKGPEGKFRATQVIVFERPDRVRVELLGAFGPSRWIAVTASGEITVLFPGRREYLEETAVEDVVGALIGIPLSPPEVMAILAGSGLPLGNHRAVNGEKRGDSVRLDLGRASIQVKDNQVQEAQKAGYRVSYPTSWKQSGRTVPDRVDIQGENLQVSITVDDLDVNVKLDPDAFVVKLPPGADRLNLAQIGGEAIFVKPNQ